MRKSNNQLRRELEKTDLVARRASHVVCVLLNRHGGSATITQNEFNSVPCGTSVDQVLGDIGERTFTVKEPLRYPKPCLASWGKFAFEVAKLTPRARIAGWRRVFWRIWKSVPLTPEEMEELE